MVILTDLSDVLIGGKHATVHTIMRRYGFKTSFKCWCRLKQTERTFNSVMRGNLKEDDYFRTFFANQDFCFGKYDIRQVFSDAFKVTIPGTMDVYRRITSCPTQLPAGGIEVSKQNGMPKIYVISDHIAEHIGEIRSNHPEVFDVVTDTFWSCELGLIKTDTGLFGMVLLLLGIEPKEAVFIDDDWRKVRAARRAGIKSIHFTNAKRLERKLNSLGFGIAPAHKGA